jgi:hypothetical protein
MMVAYCKAPWLFGAARKTTEVFSAAADGINSRNWNCAKEWQNFAVLSNRGMRSGDIAPCIRTLGTRWSLVVSFTLTHTLYTRG